MAEMGTCGRNLFESFTSIHYYNVRRIQFIFMDEERRKENEEKDGGSLIGCKWLNFY